VFSVRSMPRLYNEDQLFTKGGTTKEEKKKKSLDIEQIYGHGSQRGSMPGMTVRLVAGSKLLPCSALFLL
jgi:hypothetical protein